MATLAIVKPGMLTTVQARPRLGWQHLGVPPGGPMDEYSFRVANLIAGNDADEAAIEATLIGPELEFDGTAIIVVCGADLTVRVNGIEVPLMTPVEVRAGSRLRFGGRRRGARAYVAVRGGLDAPLVLGSRATSLSGALPGLAGRAVRAGDRLPIADRALREPLSAPSGIGLTMTLGRAEIRFVPGPDSQMFAADSRERFERAEYRITPQSNRMGYRLEGPALTVVGAGTLLSEATPIGSIQVPPSGQPIVLMADRQTTGGYPRIGTVITADLPIAGQLAPGEQMRFVRCSAADAVDALRAREHALDLLREIA